MMPRELDAFPHETTTSSGEQTADSAEARIQFLLDQGPLAEADGLCKQATEQFPESDRLQKLASEIREKEAAVRQLLERGEEALGQRNFGVADEFFAEARRRLPLDGELADYIAEIIHEHAQKVVGQDQEAADTLEEGKQRAEEAVPASCGDLILLPKHPPTVSRSRAAARAFAILAAFVAIALIPWKTVLPRFVHLISPGKGSTTGALRIRTNVPDAEIFINGRKYVQRAGDTPLEILLPPNTYQVRAANPEYIDHGPVTVTITQGGETTLDLPLDPKPAMLRIQGAEAGTEVKVDGVLVGSVARGAELTGQLSPGLHAIELSRAGYLPRKIVLQLTPGKETLLSGPEVVLQSTDASERSQASGDN
ncbi:MAG TPA: PEGA domain-containing protein [Bryobacteraceae bacterium]